MNIFQILNGAKTGTLDAKAEVMNIIKGMTPAQRKQALNMMPQVENVAKQAGISTAELSELSAQLK